LITNQDHLKGILLDVGCGQMPYKQLLMEGGAVSNYIGLDLENNPIHNNTPDILWNGKEIPLADNSVDSVLLTEVLEHVPEPTELLWEIHRVIKPGGKIFGTVPFLFNLHEVPYDFYRYTPFALERFAERTGFRIIKIEYLGGWDASLAQMIGMWLRSAKMTRISRAIFNVFLYPLYLWLISKENKLADNTDHSDFRNWPMITGLCFVFEKQSSR
jgi:2-polyprenyl-3-methyl-5-hydroxy-6-metoxy-1,4-benzoquinol methylase